MSADAIQRGIDALDRAMEIVAALPESVPSEWQDISTAPRDGARFLVIDAHTGDYDIALWHRDHVCGVNDGWATFTHWQPIPSPPGPAP